MVSKTNQEKWCNKILKYDINKSTISGVSNEYSRTRKILSL